jgi:hypothetical protein
VGELAVAAVGLAPLVEQGEDLPGLLLQQPVHRRAAGSLVVQSATRSALKPSVGAAFGKLQVVTGPAQRPAGLQRLLEQVEQR